MSTSPVVPTPSTDGTTTSTNGLPSGQSLNNMFLQLLVAQLQNQDPTDPVDPSQFVGQLAQFSELSEVTSIYTLLQQVVSATGSPGSSSGSASATGGVTAAAPAANSLLASIPSIASTSTISSTVVPFSPIPSPAPTLSNFASPAISALTGAIPSKIQGAF